MCATLVLQMQSAPVCSKPLGWRSHPVGMAISTALKKGMKHVHRSRCVRAGAFRTCRSIQDVHSQSPSSKRMLSGFVRMLPQEDRAIPATVLRYMSLNLRGLTDVPGFVYVSEVDSTPSQSCMFCRQSMKPAAEAKSYAAQPKVVDKGC